MDIKKFIEEAKEVKNLGFVFTLKQDEFTRARCAVEEFVKHYKIKLKLENGGTTVDISTHNPVINVSQKENIVLVWPEKDSAALALVPGEGDEIMLSLSGLNNQNGKTFYENGYGLYRILLYGFTPVDLEDVDARTISFDSSEAGFRRVNINRKGGDKNPHWEVKTVF